MALKRINEDLTNFSDEPEMESCTAGPIGDDMFKWSATIKGPSGSPYAGGTFLLDITFTTLYPEKPPGVSFKTKVYHPNIMTKGKSPWTGGIQRCRWQQVYKTDRALYEATAKEWTKKYAQ